jgi:type VI secretion system secreted protein Hcp
MANTPRPSSLSRTLALVPPVVALVVQQVEGSIFLKIESTSGTIDGESTDKAHAAWINAESVQFGVATTTTMSSGTLQAGKSSGSDLVITKSLDKSSPILFLVCAQGTRQPKVTLEMTAIGPEGATAVFYRITLTGVIISSLDSSSGGDRPSETVSMSYEKITTEYFMQDPKTGTIPTSPASTSTWNFATGSTK